MSSIEDPAKLKVVELRAELSTRGLDTKGNKAVLVKRLKDALEAETGDDLPDTSIADTSTEDVNSSVVSQKSPSPEPRKDPSPQPVSVNSSPETVEPADEYEVTKAPADDSDPEKMEVEEPKKETPISKLKPKKEDPPTKPAQIPPEPAKSEPLKVQEDAMDSEDAESQEKDSTAADANGDADDSSKSDSAEPRNRKSKSRWGSVPDASEDSDMPMPEDSAEIKSDEQTAEVRGEKRRRSASRSPERNAKIRNKSPIHEDEPELNTEVVHLSWVDSDLNLQIDKSNFLSAKPFHEGAFGWMWAGARASSGIKSGKVFYEVKITEECNWEDGPKVIAPPEVAKVEKKPEAKAENGDAPEADKNGDEAKGEETPMEEDEEKPKEEAEEKAKGEPEEKSKEEVKEKSEDEAVKEKSKEEDKEKPSAEAEEKPSEKVEEKPSEEAEEKPSEAVEEKPKEEEEVAEKAEAAVPEAKKPLVHLLRVGWSTTCSSLQLGESKYSYGYESTGQTIRDSAFDSYGETFAVGDVIGSYLDLTSDPATITYTVNGKLQDVAFSVPHSEFPEGGLTLFPHVLTRNYAFEVNFGSRDEPLTAERPAQLEEYTFVAEAPEKIDGPKRSDERKTCEVILMCGIPASGKTHWVNEHVANNPEKRYTVLGNSQLIQRMNVNAKPLKETWQGKWAVLVDKCTKCLNKLQDLAGTRRRNYIIDQTNVFSSAQRRKLRPFDGFHRRAVVVVVADEEQATRERAHQEADGKDVPDTAVLEMKANMTLPTTGDWLDEIVWAGLGEEEAKAAVQKYNQQGKAAGYGQNQRRNSRDNRSQWHNRNNNRRNDYRDNRDNRNNRWGGGGGGPRQGGGGWNNPRSGSGGGPRRDNRGGSGGPRGDWRHNGGNNPRHGGGGGAGGGYNNRSLQSGGYNRGQRSQGGHRSQGGNWSQGGGGGSSWGGQGGNWGSSGSQGWGGQGGWQGGQGGGSWQGGQGQGSGQQQWKGYGQQQGGGYQGYAQGYQNYPNWNYYGQYAQNWNPQGQTQSGSTAITDTTSSNQYNQYTPQQQAAWAQYAQQGSYSYSASSSTPSTNTSTTNK